MKYTYILTTAIILLMCGTASAWLSGYDHRMNITVNNGGASTLTNYQFNFTNDTNVLVAAGHMQATGADCRVTNASDNLIPFWNETTFNATGTEIWANATTLPVGDNTFYMYYGNTGASSVVNGTNTFEFFDDFSEVWTDVELGSTGSTWNRIRNIDIKDSYAYVCTNGYFRVVNISVPTNPNQVANIAIVGDNLECKISGNYAYITNGYQNYDKIHVINISDPLNPSIEGSLEDAINLEEGHGGWIDGDYFYVTSYIGNRLTIVNVSDKSNPVVQGSIYDVVNLSGAHDVIVEENYAYVTSHWGNDVTEGAFVVVDISDKSNPTIIGDITHVDLRGGTGIGKKDNYVYVGAVPNTGAHSGERLMIVINVSDVNNPAIETYVNDMYMYRCRIEGNYLWAASTSDLDYGKFDISTPSTPVKISEIHYSGASDVMDIAVSGDYCYAAKRDDGDCFVVLKNTLEDSHGDWNTYEYNGGSTWITQNDRLEITTPISAQAHTFKNDPMTAHGKIFETDVIINITRGPILSWAWQTTSMEASVRHATELWWNDNGDIYWRYSATNGGTNQYGIITNVAQVTDHKYRYKIAIYPSSKTLYYIKDLTSDSVIVNHVQDTADFSSASLYPNLKQEGDGGTIILFWDNPRVRKYASPEPTSSLGAEEDAPSGNIYIPPTPVSLVNTTGNFWVTHTWSAGSGNVTDGYNISVNDMWHNTTNTFYTNTYSANAWQNITIWAYNSSGTGTMSEGNVSQNTQVPSEPAIIIMISQLGDIFGAIILTVKAIFNLIIDVFPFIIAMIFLSSFAYLIGKIFGRRR